MYQINFTERNTARYVRKSSEDTLRQVQSIESQIDVLTEIEERENIKITKTYKDKASAYKPNNREEFSQLLQDINDGKIDGILCWKADRLARNHIEGGVILHYLEKGILKFIKTPDRTYLPTDNMLPLVIEFGMSNQYSRELSTGVKRGNKTKIKNGGWCSVAPQGYTNNRDTKTIDIDPERFKLVRKFWDLALTNSYSLTQICKIADKLGFTTRRKKKIGGINLSPSTLHGILTSPFYYGKIKNGKNEGLGSHKPMVTYEEFKKVQSIFNNKGHKAKTGNIFEYTGLFRCGECNCRVTAETKVKYKCPKCKKWNTAKHPRMCTCGYNITSNDIEKGAFYTYYHCSKSKQKCSQKSITEDSLKKEVLSFLSRFSFDQQFIKWSELWFSFIEKQLVESKEKLEEQQNIKYKRLKTQRLRLLDIRLDGEIDEELFQEKKECLNKQIEAIEFQNKRKSAGHKVKELLTFIEDLQKRYKEYPSKERKILLNKISSNHYLIDKKAVMEAKKPYLIIESLRIHKNLEIEPPLSLCMKDLKGGSKACYQVWYSMLDEFRTNS